MTMPQGALSGPPETRVRILLPLVSNTSTAPRPAPSTSSLPDPCRAKDTKTIPFKTCTLNGEYPAGSDVSVNMPVWWNWLSKALT